MAKIEQVRILVSRHRATGLYMAFSKDLQGFHVHAHSLEELKDKLRPALGTFMKATGRPVNNVEVKEEYPMAGYETQSFIALAEAA